MNRDRFTNNPTGEETRALPRDTRTMLKEAGHALQELRKQTLSRETLDELILAEAQASANSENEFDPERIRRHADALGRFLRFPNGEHGLLELHRRMMAGQQHAQPGGYRTVNVRVGRYRPPRPELVPSLMNELFDRIHRQMDQSDEHQVTRAVWTHLEFENIHPFADGNGRTGRALMQAAMGCTLPLSRFILRERPTYYDLFDRADWTAWLSWFCWGIQEEHQCFKQRHNQQESGT